MKVYTLKRITSNLECVTGILIYEQTPIVLTLECPWAGNVPNVSCIPAGEYYCEKYSSNKYGNTYKVKDVPSRSYILFHSGNIVNHTRGCILVGTYFGKLNQRQAVLNSRKAMKVFRNKLNNESKFLLRILDI